MMMRSDTAAVSAAPGPPRRAASRGRPSSPLPPGGAHSLRQPRAHLLFGVAIASPRRLIEAPNRTVPLLAAGKSLPAAAAATARARPRPSQPVRAAARQQSQGDSPVIGSGAGRAASGGKRVDGATSTARRFDFGELRYALNATYAALSIFAVEALKGCAGSGSAGPLACLALCGPFVSFFLAVPLLEMLLPSREPMLEPSAVPQHDGSSAPVFNSVERLSVLAHISVCIYAYHAVSSLSLQGFYWPLVAVGVLSLGVYGITINAAMHDLGHSTSRLDRQLAKLWLSWVMFVPYSLQHGKQHHAHNMSRLDWHTASKDQTFVSFFSRYVTNHFKATNSRQRFMEYVAVPLGMAAMVLFAFGVNGLILHVSSALMIVYGLSVFDYIVHYGLHTEDVIEANLPSAEAVPQSVACTWADTHSLTKWFAFNVTSHAHHHHNPKVPGSHLMTIRGGPVCPVPEAVIALLVPFPLLFRAVMHPVLDQYMGGGHQQDGPSNHQQK